MVVVIVGRELAVTGLRGIASAGGHVMAASWLGKGKTLSQNVAIGALIFHYPTLGLPAHAIGMTLLAASHGTHPVVGFPVLPGLLSGPRGRRASPGEDRHEPARGTRRSGSPPATPTSG